MNLYVRIRGRVHGPLTLDKLKDLVAKGQLNRIHEVSPDGVQWRAAATVPELFQVTTTARPTSNLDSMAASQPDADRFRNQQAAEPMWHYAIGGDQQGPVPQQQVVDLIRSGHLKSFDLVWKKGMEEWLEAQHVPELVDNASNTSPQATTDPQRAVGESTQTYQPGQFPQAVIAENISKSNVQPVVDEVDPREVLIGELAESVDWIQRAMITSYVVAGVAELVALGMLLLALQEGRFSTLVVGLFAAIDGGLLVWMGLALAQAQRTISIATQIQSDNAIADAVVKMRPTWQIYSLMLVAVLLTLMVIGITVILGGQSPWGSGSEADTLSDMLD